jgi:hypothetical protein
MRRTYRPANGTEGMGFMERWCARCAHDTDTDCDILTRTMVYELHDKEYPAEWTADTSKWRDGGGEARCSAFVAAEKGE